MKVLIIIGTRPEAIKLLPLCLRLKEAGVAVEIVNTGQHKELLDPLWHLFNIQPNHILQVIRKGQSLSSLTANLLLQLEQVVEKQPYDYIVVQGDTSSCMVGSLLAFYHHVKLVHVEAGLRTYNMQSPFPEEFNRRVTSLVASIHFTPTEQASQNLLNENVVGQVYMSGNTGIDALQIMHRQVLADKIKYEEKFRSYIGNQMILITGHRRENHGSRFVEIFSSIRELAIENPDISFVYPVHFNPKVREQADELLEDVNNIYLIPPVQYDEMIFLMGECYLIMTDSGGIQEEAPSLNKPVIVLRDTTERPEGVQAGASILVGYQKENIKKAFYDLIQKPEYYAKMAGVANPYGDGKACDRILAYLIQSINE